MKEKALQLCNGLRGPDVPQHVRKVSSDTSPSPPNCDNKGGGWGMGGQWCNVGITCWKKNTAKNLLKFNCSLFLKMFGKILQK